MKNLLKAFQQFGKTHLSLFFHESDFVFILRLRGIFVFFSLFTRGDRAVGIAGEKIAAAVLEKDRHVILERNWKALRGEIDIIAYKDRRLVFCEVKARKLCHEGRYPALTAVDYRKQRQIKRLASFYIRKHSRRLKGIFIKGAHYDVVSVAYRGRSWVGVAGARHYKDAFGCLLA